MFLLFNMSSRLIIPFLPRSKRLLISWLQSLSAVIWEPKKVRPITVSIFSQSICHEVMGPDAMILVFWMLSFKSSVILKALRKSCSSCPKTVKDRGWPEFWWPQENVSQKMHVHMCIWSLIKASLFVFIPHAEWKNKSKSNYLNFQIAQNLEKKKSFL